MMSFSPRRRKIGITTKNMNIEQMSVAALIGYYIGSFVMMLFVWGEKLVIRKFPTIISTSVLTFLLYFAGWFTPLHWPQIVWIGLNLISAGVLLNKEKNDIVTVDLSLFFVYFFIVGLSQLFYWWSDLYKVF